MNAINDDVGETGNHQLAGAFDAAGAAEKREPGKTATAFVKFLTDPAGSCGIVLLNAADDVVEVLGCRARPANAHLGVENLF